MDTIHVTRKEIECVIQDGLDCRIVGFVSGIPLTVPNAQIPFASWLEENVLGTIDNASARIVVVLQIITETTAMSSAYLEMTVGDTTVVT